MPDITMCKDKKCPDNESCYRYTARPNPYRQSYFSMTPRKLNTKTNESTCEHYVDNSD